MHPPAEGSESKSEVDKTREMAELYANHHKNTHLLGNRSRRSYANAYHSPAEGSESESEDEETREMAELRTLDLELTMDLDKMAAEGHACVRFSRMFRLVYDAGRVHSS